jgi:hypothetical protein
MLKMSPSSSSSSSLRCLAIAFLLNILQLSTFYPVKVLTFCPSCPLITTKTAFTKLRNNGGAGDDDGQSGPKSKVSSLLNDNHEGHDDNDEATISRRKFSSLIFRTSVASAWTGLSLNEILFQDPLNASASDDLTSQMFNEDGSLKQGFMNGITEKDLQAKDKTVSVIFPVESATLDEKSRAIVSIDGKDLPIDSTREGIKASYSVPEKWTAAPEYLDTLLSSREKACDRISVYQVPGTFSDYSTLDKATTVGVAKALGFNSVPTGILPKTLLSADIVSGRKVSKLVKSSSGGDNEAEGKEGDKLMYYEFDLAVAPDTCGRSAENLGLGFCPYDTIVLLSATIIDGKMMVCAVTCTKDEWKRSNSDLKRVRNSFFVEKTNT